MGRGLAILFAISLGSAACTHLRHTSKHDAGADSGADTGSGGGPAIQHLWLAYIEELATGTELRVIDVARGTPTPKTLTEGADNLDWSPDGKWLNANLGDHRSVLAKFDSDEPGAIVELSSGATSLYDCWLSPSSTRILCRSSDTQLEVVELPSLTVSSVTGVASAKYDYLFWSSDGRFVVPLVDSVPFALRFIDTFATSPTFTLIDPSARGLIFSPDSHYLAFDSSGAQPGTWLFDTTNGNSQLLSSAENGFFGMAWTSGGEALVYEDEADGLTVFKPSTNESVKLAPAGSGALSVSPDGSRIFYNDASDQNVLADSSVFPPKAWGPTEPGSLLCWSPGGRYFAIETSTAGIGLVDTQTPGKPAIWTNHPDNLSNAWECAFYSDRLLIWRTFVSAVLWAEEPSWKSQWVPELDDFTWLEHDLSWANDFSRVAYKSVYGGQLVVSFHQPILEPINVSKGPVRDFGFQP